MTAASCIVYQIQMVIIVTKNTRQFHWNVMIIIDLKDVIWRKSDRKQCIKCQIAAAVVAKYFIGTVIILFKCLCHQFQNPQVPFLPLTLSSNQRKSIRNRLAKRIPGIQVVVDDLAHQVKKLTLMFWPSESP